MTSFFAYDELTWPEVARLPRDTPLVIPLGTGFDQQQLSAALGAPDRAGLLPALPFGWHGSVLAVPEAVLGALLNNLLDSLRADGFTRVCALAPQGLQLGLAHACIAQPLAGGQQPDRQQLPPAAATGSVILFPIGHTEQHGYHLPLSTDNIIIDHISRASAALVPELAYSMPLMPYGVSTHRSSFAGTLNTGGRAFEDFWLAVVDTLVARGFDRMYLMSGHGGNCSFLTTVVKYAGERHRRIFCATAYLHTSGPAGAASIKAHRVSAVGGMGHAGELETSMVLALRPDLTHMQRVVDEIGFVATASYYMDWAEGGALVANPPWDDDTATGSYGAGSVATAAHGHIWLAAAAAEKAEHVREIHEQQRRREQRRDAGYGLWGIK
ncbi:MAG: creatininase family protein [Chloroflexi bacterium]|nr:MAG: creatininase family protein [Chloroflexota bacterium]